MILGIGIDTIEIERFCLWHTKSQKSLLRIYSPEEIEYCLENTTKSAERFAVRFAAREALFKALQPLVVARIPLLTLCKQVKILKGPMGNPIFNIDWQHLNPYLCLTDNFTPTIHLSLSHNRTIATAIVIIESQKNAVFSL